LPEDIKVHVHHKKLLAWTMSRQKHPLLTWFIYY